VVLRFSSWREISRVRFSWLLCWLCAESEGLPWIRSYVKTSRDAFWWRYLSIRSNLRCWKFLFIGAFDGHLFFVVLIVIVVEIDGFGDVAGLGCWKFLFGNAFGGHLLLVLQVVIVELQ